MVKARSSRCGQQCASYFDFEITVFTINNKLKKYQLK